MLIDCSDEARPHAEPPTPAWFDRLDLFPQRRCRGRVPLAFWPTFSKTLATTGRGLSEVTDLEPASAPASAPKWLATAGLLLRALGAARRGRRLPPASWIRHRSAASSSCEGAQQPPRIREPGASPARAARKSGGAAPGPRSRGAGLGGKVAVFGPRSAARLRVPLHSILGYTGLVAGSPQLAPSLCRAARAPSVPPPVRCRP